MFGFVFNTLNPNLHIYNYILMLLLVLTIAGPSLLKLDYIKWMLK